MSNKGYSGPCLRTVAVALSYILPPLEELDILLSLGFTEEEYRRMLWDNAYEIFVK